MDSPNVWKYDAPNTLITRKINQLNSKNEKQLIKRIQSHPFNKLVSSYNVRISKI